MDAYGGISSHYQLSNCLNLAKEKTIPDHISLTAMLDYDELMFYYELKEDNDLLDFDVNI